MPPRVVNMVPFANSGETRQDSEPNLTVNPSNPLQMVGSAFTPDPAGGVNAPIYVSTDGGENWVRGGRLGIGARIALASCRFLSTRGDVPEQPADARTGQHASAGAATRQYQALY